MLIGDDIKHHTIFKTLTQGFQIIIYLVENCFSYDLFKSSSYEVWIMKYSKKYYQREEQFEGGKSAELGLESRKESPSRNGLDLTQ